MDNLNEVLRNGRIIDNKRIKSLNMKEALNIISEGSDSFKCAVGYLYLSGLVGIIDSLKNLKEIKILMGYETDKLTKEELVKAFREEFNQLDYDEHTKPAMKLFYQLIKNYKTLKIRAYFGENNRPEKLHSKAYLFIRDSSTENILDKYRAGIIGSSNLTRSGLVGNTELNTIITNETDLEAIDMWFESLWDKGSEEFEKLKIADVITESIEKSKFKKEIEDIFRYIKPKEFFKVIIKYLRADYLFEEYEESKLFKFQHIDFIRALNNLNSKNYRGCFITSSVGLGKSYVASQIAKYFIHCGEKVLIIAPAGLVSNQDQWPRYLKEFNIEDKVDLESMGKLQKNPEKFDLNRYSENYGLIIVDEAHNYRNPGSNRNKNLRKIIDENGKAKCVFLTATPINTSLDDLINLINLFHRKGNNLLFDKLIRDLTDIIDVLKEKEYDQLTDDLKEKLLEVQENIEKEIFVKSTGVTIKTSEEYIKELHEFTGVDITKLPEPEVKEIKYLLDTKYTEVIDGIVDFITNLSAAHLRLLDPDKGIRLSGIFKWLLYKRFESDVTAYYLTLKRIHRRNSQIINSVESLDITHLENDENEDDIEIKFEINFKEKLTKILDIIKSGEGESYLNVVNDLKKDTELIEKEIKKIEQYLKPNSKILFDNDQKIHQLQSIINYNDKKKILIFTQYKDTLSAIKEYMLDDLDEDEIKFIDSKTNNKEKLISEFNNPESHLKIIVTTDTLSEGYNISGADIVINFDIPYNPVRIIQRIGRATRLDNPKKIEVLNFRPDDKIDVEIKLVETLELRIKDIIRFIGVEYRIWFETEKELLAQRRKMDTKIYLEILEKIRSNLREGAFEKLEIPLYFSKPILALIQKAIKKYEITADDIKLLKIPSGKNYTLLKGKKDICAIFDTSDIYNEKLLVNKEISEIEKISDFEKTFENELKTFTQFHENKKRKITEMEYYNDQIDNLVDTILDYISEKNLIEIYPNVSKLIHNLENVREKCGSTTESKLRLIKTEIQLENTIDKIDKLNKELEHSFTKIYQTKLVPEKESLFVIGFEDD